MARQGFTRGQRMLTVRCPLCFGMSILDEKWRAPKGLDPLLRKYDCTTYKCGASVYVHKSVPDNERNRKIDADTSGTLALRMKNYSNSSLLNPNEPYDR